MKLFIFSSGLMRIGIEAKTKADAQRIFKTKVIPAASPGINLKRYKWEITESKIDAK